VVFALSLLQAALEAAVALVVFALLQTITDPGAPLTLPLIGDLEEAFPSVERDALFAYAGGVIGLFFILRGAVSIFQVYLQARVAQNTGVEIAQRLVRGYLAMPYPFHLHRNSAELIRNATSSVNAIVGYVLVPLATVLTQSFLAVGLAVVLLGTAPLATLGAGTVLAVLVFVLLRSIHPRVKGYGQLSQDMSKAVLQVMQQSFQGFREVVLLRCASYFERRFVKARGGLARARFLSATLAEAPRVVIETVSMLFIVAFFTYATVATASDEEAVAVLGLFAYAVLRMIPALNRIVVALNMLPFGGPAMQAVCRDIELAADVSRPSPRPEAASPRALLQRELVMENVSFTYEGTDEPVIRDVSIHIARGEAFGFAGSTGGGKTTCVDLLTGLLMPTQGRVLVDGVDVSGDSAADWQRQLGIVPQTVFLLDDTLRRNIAFGIEDPEIDDERVAAAIQLAQLQEFVASLPEGRETLVGERGVRLSGGQRQRVAIARALYRDPAVLFLDEGTSALDRLTEVEIMEALQALKGERTIIMVAHRLTTLRGCDRIVIFEYGRVVDLGTYDELESRNEQFRRMTAL
jgi:ATP-binding cassette subfamily C protein